MLPGGEHSPLHTVPLSLGPPEAPAWTSRGASDAQGETLWGSQAPGISCPAAGRCTRAPATCTQPVVPELNRGSGSRGEPLTVPPAAKSDAVAGSASSPAPQPTCLAAGLSDSAAPKLSRVLGVEGSWLGCPSKPGRAPPRQGVGVVPDKRASKLRWPLTHGGGGGRLQLWPVTSVLARPLRSSRLGSSVQPPAPDTHTRSLHPRTSVW